ncbi:unnamed protein product [Sphagnum balticum]
MTAVSTVAGVRAAGKMVPTTTTTATTMPVVRAVQRDGGVMQGDNKPWVAPRARIFPGAESATETSAVATDYATVPGGRSNLFGFSPSQGRVDSDEDSDEDGEVLRVDNESIDDEDQLAISNLGIPPGVVESLAKRGITQLFPIQRAVMDPAMQGRDLIARAKTGTGKTLAFGIPIIHNIVTENEVHRIVRRPGRAPRALVLAPTRELAKQVEREFMETAPMLATVCVYGGVSITMQQRQLERGVDIAVGTPGRIQDLIDRRVLDLHDIRHFVLDEADQMLAVGFEEDVERILEQMPRNRQGMLFSATMPTWVKKLARKYLKDPLTIDLVGETDEKLAEGIKLYALSTGQSAKRSILNDLIAVYAKGGKSIVFTQTKRDADDVAFALGRVVGCEALHGDITQSQREKTLNGFREGRFSVLVATDVAARGLDIPNVDLVIHYEIPNDPETFVHRSGRTGRAGKEGSAILMFTDSQLRTMRLIERDIGCKFERIGAPHMDDVLRASGEQATQLIKRVHPELTDVFMQTAETLLADQGPSALAAALAHLSGFTQPPASRSLLTHEEGLTTLRLVRMSSSQPLGPRVVMGVLSDIWQAAADNVGKIRVIADPKVAGAVFDLPEDIAKELLSKPLPPGDVIDAPKKLPRLDEDDFGGRGRTGDMYGRFSQQGGGRFSGGRGSLDRGGRPGGRGIDRFVGRSGGDRFNDRTVSRGGGHPDDWSRGSPSSGSRFADEDRFSRSPSGRSDRSFDRGTFSGTCFVCNQPGHRASDCPQRR